LDEITGRYSSLEQNAFITNEPIFKYEDVSCGKMYNMNAVRKNILTSSCEPQRELLLSKAMFSITEVQ
jgi:hypothetical protein